MNQYMLVALMLSALGLAACDKPTVVNMPAPESIPGPAGVTGSAGEQGVQGDAGVQGDTGKSGDDTTVIVIPPEESSPNN